MRIPFRNIVPRITGITTPLFGVSWEPPESEREIVRRLITFLEDRRALYYPYEFEVPRWVAESILEIRHELTDLLRDLDEASTACPPMRAMHGACRKFVDTTQPRGQRSRNPRHRDREFFTALGELRGVFGIHIGQLCVSYGIDIGTDLAAILPEADPEPQPRG